MMCLSRDIENHRATEIERISGIWQRALEYSRYELQAATKFEESKNDVDH